MLLLAGWFWLRDSSLVAVRTVEVTGIDGPQGARVRAALEEAARSMTTLHVRQAALDTAAAPFSIVKRIEVSTDFPHTMRIHVVTNVAVGAVVVDGRRIAVTSDGTILRDVTAAAALPQIPLRSAPGRRAPHRAGRRRRGRGAAAPLRPRCAAAWRACRRRPTAASRSSSPTGRCSSSAATSGWGQVGGRRRACWRTPTRPAPATIDVSRSGAPGGLAGCRTARPATGESDVPTLPEGDDRRRPDRRPRDLAGSTRQPPRIRPPRRILRRTDLTLKLRSRVTPSDGQLSSSDRDFWHSATSVAAREWR